MADKIAAANRINDLLKSVLRNGGFKLKYRIVVDPPAPADRDWEQPVIEVDFSGPDSSLLMERGGELLRALEHIAINLLHLEHEEHDKISFDCQGYKAARMEELKTAAAVAAERVRQSGQPYQFAPMTSRERRVVHLALRAYEDLKTESTGEAGRRAVVVYPKDFDPARARPLPSLGHRRR